MKEQELLLINSRMFKFQKKFEHFFVFMLINYVLTILNIDTKIFDKNHFQ